MKKIKQEVKTEVVAVEITRDELASIMAKECAHVLDSFMGEDEDDEAFALMTSLLVAKFSANVLYQIFGEEKDGKKD